MFVTPIRNTDHLLPAYPVFITKEKRTKKLLLKKSSKKDPRFKMQRYLRRPTKMYPKTVICLPNKVSYVPIKISNSN